MVAFKGPPPETGAGLAGLSLRKGKRHQARRAPAPRSAPQPKQQRPAFDFPGFMQQLQQMGVAGDNRLAHVQDGEMVIPKEAQTPGLVKHANDTMRQRGMDPEAYRAGSGREQRNPRTGQPMYAGFDEVAFFADYPEVAQEVAKGTWKSGHHFNTAWREFTGGFDYGDLTESPRNLNAYYYRDRFLMNPDWANPRYGATTGTEGVDPANSGTNAVQQQHDTGDAAGTSQGDDGPGISGQTTGTQTNADVGLPTDMGLMESIATVGLMGIANAGPTGVGRAVLGPAISDLLGVDIGPMTASEAAQAVGVDGVGTGPGEGNSSASSGVGGGNNPSNPSGHPDHGPVGDNPGDNGVGGEAADVDGDTGGAVG
ncbi:MAG: hypothetical protein NXI16_01210 [Alphaproteobacteria bacterium]|nr:hypothetical protein [Alphaproteobacteria bacterium]